MEGATAVIMDGRISKRRSWSMGSWFGRRVGIKSGSLKGRVASPKSTYPWLTLNSRVVTMRTATRALSREDEQDILVETALTNTVARGVKKAQLHKREDTRRWAGG